LVFGKNVEVAGSGSAFQSRIQILIQGQIECRSMRIRIHNTAKKNYILHSEKNIFPLLKEYFLLFKNYQKLVDK
jgi:hypothetical protein